MTEEQWLTCESPRRMLACFGGQRPGLAGVLNKLFWRRPALPRPSDRKLRLFLVACARPLASVLGPDGWAALEAAERIADEDFDTGQPVVTCCELRRLGGRVYPSKREEERRAHAMDAIRLAERLSPFQLKERAGFGPRLQAVIDAVWHLARAVEIGAGPEECQKAGSRYARFQADVLRCVVGNPFRPPVAVAWPALHETMARTIYDERRDADLPLLADALEDAGGGDAAILTHLRGPGPHARGCWALDLILAKDR